MKTRIGAHVSTAGGMWKAVERISEMGGNCLQVFSTSPRGWGTAKISKKDVEKFLSARKQFGVDPVYFHASYLINLSDGGRIGTLSKKVLIAELKTAKQLGVRGSIVHLGSFKDATQEDIDRKHWKTLIGNIEEVIDGTPKETIFIAENAGTRKIGKSIDELARIVNDVGSKRLRVCLDTCHLFAAGYGISTKKGLEDFLKEFDTKIGLDRLELIHTNDSRDPFASLRDRHENIGKGTLGKETFKLLLNHPKLKHVPFILEVPGYDDLGPDKKNIDILKSLV